MVLVAQNFGEVILPTEPVVPTPIVPPDIALDAVATAEEASTAAPELGIVPPVPQSSCNKPVVTLNLILPTVRLLTMFSFRRMGRIHLLIRRMDAFSTFGMDVDTASYAITRRYLRDGYLPPPEAVRVEEFVTVKAFDYNYTPPSDETFAIHLESAPSKFGEGKRLQLLRIGIQGLHRTG